MWCKWNWTDFSKEDLELEREKEGRRGDRKEAVPWEANGDGGGER